MDVFTVAKTLQSCGYEHDASVPREGNLFPGDIVAQATPVVRPYARGELGTRRVHPGGLPGAMLVMKLKRLRESRHALKEAGSTRALAGTPRA